MFVDEEIQDDTETPDAFGMYGDSTHQADYSADHHQPALRYNTPEDSESSDDLETDRTSISDFNSTPTFHLGDMEDEEDHQMEQEFHHDNMDSTPLQTVNMFPPEMHETENPEIQQESTSTENNPAPKYHYWLRERKPKKLNEYGDIDDGMHDTEKVVKKRGKKKSHQDTAESPLSKQARIQKIRNEMNEE